MMFFLSFRVWSSGGHDLWPLVLLAKLVDNSILTLCSLSRELVLLLLVEERCAWREAGLGLPGSTVLTPSPSV